MIFNSDNWAGVHPAVMEAMAREGGFAAPSYAGSQTDASLKSRFETLFETERPIEVFTVSTGTAANALALAALDRPGSVIFSHPEAHIRVDECNAPSWYTQGGRIMGVDGPLGLMRPEALEAAIAETIDGGLNAGRPTSLSITQATESGTVYSCDQIAALAQIAHNHGLPVHMDGSRFANAIAATGATPADMTWKAGVDVLCMGATKNGAIAAEAIIFFDADRARDMHHLRKRAGHLVSKSRFLACQFTALLDDDLWLKLATHANTMARQLADHVEASGTMRLAWQPAINEVFAVTSADMVSALKQAGVGFSHWQPPTAEKAMFAPGDHLLRFVTSFQTSEADIKRFASLITRA